MTLLPKSALLWQDYAVWKVDEDGTPYEEVSDDAPEEAKKSYEEYVELAKYYGKRYQEEGIL